MVAKMEKYICPQCACREQYQCTSPTLRSCSFVVYGGKQNVILRPEIAMTTQLFKGPRCTTQSVKAE